MSGLDHSHHLLYLCLLDRQHTEPGGVELETEDEVVRTITVKDRVELLLQGLTDLGKLLLLVDFLFSLLVLQGVDHLLPQHWELT